MKRWLERLMQLRRTVRLAQRIAYYRPYLAGRLVDETIILSIGGEAGEVAIFTYDLNEVRPVVARESLQRLRDVTGLPVIDEIGPDTWIGTPGRMVGVQFVHIR